MNADNKYVRFDWASIDDIAEITGLTPEEIAQL